MFYQSDVVSTIFLAVVCWGAGIKAKANSLKKPESFVGSELITMKEVVRERMMAKQLLVDMDHDFLPPP